MKEIYSNEITDPSLKELGEFAKWYNEKLGNHPIIVGGWAVYCYTKGLGSKDIDVVFLGDEAKHATLAAYFYSHGYTERSRTFFDKEFVKPIRSGNIEVDIIIDAVSSRRFIIFEGKKARIPWSWAVKHNQEYSIGESKILIPTIELLLTYKLGAVLGRHAYLKTGLDVAYYRSKLWKDVYDVISLSGLKIDKEKVTKFLTDSGLDHYKEEMMQIMEDNIDDEMKSILQQKSVSLVREIIS